MRGKRKRHSVLKIFGHFDAKINLSSLLAAALSARPSAHVTTTKVEEHRTGISSATGTGTESWNEIAIETGTETEIAGETESENENGTETGAETETESGTGKETVNETESESETDPSDVNPIIIIIIINTRTDLI